MSLEPYTNTYTDVDGTIADSDDIVAEFDRIAAYIDAWSDSYEAIGATSVSEKTVITGGNTDVEPALGLIQSVMIDPAVVEINFNVLQRKEGEPYRIYVVLRFGSPLTIFTVSAPASRSHIFGVSRQEFSPAQVIANGYYAAVLIVTYGTDATHVQVYADNSEKTTVSSNDILQEASV